MHSRSESGIPLDWHDVLRIYQRERAEAQRLRNLEHVNEVLKLLDRQPTPQEIAEAQAILEQPELQKP
jgi:hypothetical protein